MKNIVEIDPRDFISPPYIQCPNCKKQDTFGVLPISGNRHTRRCKECCFTDTYKLPSLNKKVVYLDQFVISEMAKAINKKLKKSEKVDKFYRKLFEELDTLAKLQLIICPDSVFQEQESMAYNFEVLKKMYERLSYKISFYHPAEIERYQVCEGFKNSFDNTPASNLQLSVLSGNKNAWQSRFLTSIDSDISGEEIRDYQIRRQSIHDGIKALFKIWQSEINKTFKDWYEEEVTSYGKIMIEQYNKYKDYCASISILQRSVEEIRSVVERSGVILVSPLMSYLSDHKNDDEKLKIVVSYLQSSAVTKLPFNKINAALWAAIAHQAAYGGRQNPPNIGMANDIKMVSALLPYCDAIFVDSDMFSLLNFLRSKTKDFFIWHKNLSSN